MDFRAYSSEPMFSMDGMSVPIKVHRKGKGMKQSPHGAFNLRKFVGSRTLSTSSRGRSKSLNFRRKVSNNMGITTVSDVNIVPTPDGPLDLLDLKVSNYHIFPHFVN